MIVLDQNESVANLNVKAMANKYKEMPFNSSLNLDPQQRLPLRGGVAVLLARRYAY